MMERTSTIRASLREVERTLLIAIALVVAVVFVFLRSVQATLIPTVAVPVSLVATFSVMYLAGFSLNNLSLMALIVAAGFVVDDAIVVLENVSRHVERGMNPTQAALVGTREVGFTVLSMSVSLVAVFMPLLFMGGIVGRLFREFAVTLSAAVLVSLLISLTATPMMCARLLKPEHERTRGRLYRASERVFQWLLHGYRVSLAWSLRHGRFMMVLLAATIALNVYLYVAIPKGFIPTQDTGRLIGWIRADQSISFQAMRQKVADFVEIVRADPAVQNVTAFTGGGQRNSGTMFIQLKPLAERRETSDQVIERLRPQLARQPGARLFLNPVQDVRAGGRQSSGTYQYTLQGDDVAELRTWTLRLQDALQQRAGAHRRRLRPGGARPRDRPRDRPADRGAPRRHGRCDRLRARQRVRPDAGIDHLLHAQPVPGGDGGGAAVRPGARGAEGDLRARRIGRTGSALRVRPLRARQHAPRGQPPGPVRGDDGLVQSRHGCVVLRSPARDRCHHGAYRRARDDPGQQPGNRRRCSSNPSTTSRC